MCEKCVAAIKKYYPHLPEGSYGDFLMSATSFPFGSHEKVEAQLKEIVDNTDGSVAAAHRYVEKRIDEEMAALKAAREKKGEGEDGE